MFENKEIQISRYKFHLKYFTNDAIGKNIDNDKCEGLIQVVFEPFPPMFQSDVEAIFSECETELLRYIQIAVNINKEFYSNYYVPMAFNHTTYDWEKSLSSTPKIKRAFYYLDIKAR